MIPLVLPCMVVPDSWLVGISAFQQDPLLRISVELRVDLNPIRVYAGEGPPNTRMILKTAPELDNAKLFVDFLFSDEAQALVADAFLLPGRSDVKCENRSNLEDIPQLATDWNTMMGVASDTAAKLNALCQK